MVLVFEEHQQNQKTAATLERLSLCKNLAQMVKSLTHTSFILETTSEMQ